jgi:hypothetical protein
MQNSVTSEILFAHKRLCALIALERLGAFVHILDVHGKTDSSVEGLVADLAGEAILAGVMEDVAAQLTCLDEALAAVATRVRLDSGVSFHVPVQSLLGCKLCKALKNKIHLKKALHDSNYV